MRASVIIPACNAGGHIERCLMALERQTSAFRDFEVLVVDDGSSDATAEIVARHPAVRIIRQVNQGPAAARNTGARQAESSIILFTDSDCAPDPDWLEEMLQPFDDLAITGVKGAYRTEQHQLIARFVQAEYQDKYRLLSRERYIDFIDTYSAAYRKDVFLGAGGYDTSFPVACAEDVELSYRLHRQGCRMVFNPRAVVSHLHPASLGTYLRKKAKFAYWRVLALRKNPAKIARDSHTPQIMKLQLAFPPLVLLSVFGLVFSLLFLPVLMALLALFIATTMPFSVRTFRADPVVGLLSPLLLTGRSAAQCWGVGSGIWDWMVRRKT